MSINPSCHYKWRKRKNIPNRYEQNRILLTERSSDQRKKHIFHRYHMLAKTVYENTRLIFSTILHTDQSSIYSSQTFRQTPEDCNILHSMSIVKTPTGATINETLKARLNKNCYFILVCPQSKIFLNYWISLLITITIRLLRPLLVIKTRFSTKPN